MPRNILNYDTKTVVFKRVFKRKELFLSLGFMNISYMVGK